MPDEEPTVSTSTETASAEGQVAPEAQETPTGAPAAEEAATEPQPETQPSAEEDEDSRIKAHLDAAFPGVEPEAAAEGKLTLTQAEIEEREQRAAQSAADKARAQAQQEAQRLQEQAQARGRIRADMRRDVEAHVRKAVESGEATEDIIDGINRRYGLSLFEEANEEVSRLHNDELFLAMGAIIPGIAEATPEELAPLGRGFPRLADKYAAALEIALMFKERAVKAEMAEWAEKEATKRARVATEAGIKKILADIRGAQKGGELPKGEATPNGPTDADVSAHKGDLVWWSANKEAYYRWKAAQGKK